MTIDCDTGQHVYKQKGGFSLLADSNIHPYNVGCREGCCSILVMVHCCIRFSKWKWLWCLSWCEAWAAAPLKPICFPQIRLTLLIPCSAPLQNFPPPKKTCFTLLITNLHLPQCNLVLTSHFPTNLICIFHLRIQTFLTRESFKKVSYFIFVKSTHPPILSKLFFISQMARDIGLFKG